MIFDKIKSRSELVKVGRQCEFYCFGQFEYIIHKGIEKGEKVYYYGSYTFTTILKAVKHVEEIKQTTNRDYKLFKKKYLNDK